MRLLLTGTTGLLGQQLLQRLLQQGHEVALLLPKHSTAAVDERRVLTSHWGSKATELVKNVQFLPGSLIQEQFGLTGVAYRQLANWTETVVHCDGSPSFQASYPQGLRLENVQSTEHVLNFARTAAAENLHYVSTAYVCGRREGLVPEEEPTDLFGFRNQYERFKYNAERLVYQFAHREGITTSIYRPSIILENPGPMGLSQAIALQLDWLMNLGKYLSGTALCERFRQGLRFAVAGDPDATLNVVSVDYCAQAIASIFAQPQPLPYQVYHLVNPEPPSMQLLTNSVGEVLGVDARVVSTLGPEVAWEAEIESGLLRRLERLIYRSYRVYLPYHFDRLVFDDSNTRQALAGTGITCPRIDQPFLVGFLRERLHQRAQQFSTLLDRLAGI